MKIIEVPIYNADGSVQFTQLVSPQEAKTLLQFAINFLAATGISATAILAEQEGDTEKPIMND